MIQNDLMSTLEIEDRIIVDYMFAHEYALRIDVDGSPVWTIYRQR